jgi:predicted nucleotidyltransferase
MYTMQRDEIVTTIRTHERQLREEFFVSSLALFGSAARDEARPDSDVDLLVEFDRRIGLLHLIGTAQYLERELGVRRVDLTLRRAVLPELRDTIFGEAIDVIGKPSLEIPAATYIGSDA